MASSSSFVSLFFLAALCLLLVGDVAGFSVVFMARRGKKGGLKRTLEDEGQTNVRTANQGRGQEITGVTLPAPGQVKGWQFGEGVTMACVNIEGNYYALEGQCPRCAFDLWKGTIIHDDPAFEGDRLACPTCSTTFSLLSGKRGPALKRTGLQAFVGKLAKTATEGDANKDAKAFQITIDDEDGRVFCREK